MPRKPYAPHGLSVSLLSPSGDRTIVEKDLKALFWHQLKDTAFAENPDYKTLPRTVEVARSEGIKSALAVHMNEIDGVIRLQAKTYLS